MRVGAFPLGLMPFLTPEIIWLPVCAYKLNFLWSAIDQAPRCLHLWIELIRAAL